jgi:RHS repeat-associated protein
VTTYVYDGLNMVTEYTGSSTVRSKYVFGLGLDEPLSIDQAGSLYYYHQDSLGSVNRLTNASGSVARTYSYDSFGKITSQTGTLDQPFTFTGREYDPETGLYYYRARYYDPKAGRFISKDPIGFMGGDVNLFRYVGNDPGNWVDPEGLRWWAGAGIVTNQTSQPITVTGDTRSGKQGSVTIRPGESYNFNIAWIKGIIAAIIAGNMNPFDNILVDPDSVKTQNGEIPKITPYPWNEVIIVPSKHLINRGNCP